MLKGCAGRCVNYIGKFVGFWPITVTEVGTGDRIVLRQWELRIPKVPLFRASEICDDIIISEDHCA